MREGEEREEKGRRKRVDDRVATKSFKVYTIFCVIIEQTGHDTQSQMTNFLLKTQAA